MIQENQKTNAYRIKYKNCKLKQHIGEVNNYVCLNQDCRTHCIICSLCKQEKHLSHDVRPVKVFIESIKKGYELSTENYDQQMIEVEETRYIFINKLRQTVEKVAKQFEDTERQIIERFEGLRNQILTKKSKKKQFNNLYNSFVGKTEQNIQILIQNYMPNKELPFLKNYQAIEELGNLIIDLFKQIDEKMMIVPKFEDRIIKELPAKKQQIDQIETFSLAPTIQKTDNIYKQMNINTEQTMCFFNLNFLKLKPPKKIKIRIKEVTKGTKIYMGVISHELYIKKLYKSPFLQSTDIKKDNLAFYNNLGESFGHSSKQLGTFSSNSQIIASLNNDFSELSMEMNKKKNVYQIPKKLFYFFFSITGFGSIYFDS